jgi:tRNA A37 methylthiotransferase MiaB
MDVVGVFGYSDEDGTEAATYDTKLDDDEIRERTEYVTRLVEELTSQRAEERIGERVDVLLEGVEATTAEGRAEHQGPEVDGCTTVTGLPWDARVGDLVTAVVTGSDGADLIAEAAAP